MSFSVGDLVKLKSGGPVMAIKEVLSGPNRGSYRAQWFAGKKLDSGVFPTESLILVTEED